MRESLGIAIDDHSISTALVDADTPVLGAIDDFRHPWTADVRSAASTARALTSAAAVATERAARSQLHPTTIGMVCERADVRDLVPEALLAQARTTVELVNNLEARLAYLATVDALAGVSPVLVAWPEREETVVAAINPTAGILGSAHRYESVELLSNSAVCAATLVSVVADQEPIPEMLVVMEAEDHTWQTMAGAAEQVGLKSLVLGERAPLAIGAALVAADRSVPSALPLTVAGMAALRTKTSPAAGRRWAPFALVSSLIVLAGLLTGMLTTFASTRHPEVTTTDRSNIGTTGSVPLVEEPMITNSEDHVPSADRPGHSVDENFQRTNPPPLTEVPPSCDPVADAAPAALRLSDPDTAPGAPHAAEPQPPPPPQRDLGTSCTPTKSG